MMDGIVPDNTQIIFCRAMPEFAEGPIVGERVTDVEQFCLIARPCIERALRIQPPDALGERIVTLSREILPFVSSGIAVATRDPNDYSVKMDRTGRMVACRPRRQALPVQTVKAVVTPIAHYCRDLMREVPSHLAPSAEALRGATHIVSAIQVIAGPNSTRYTPSPALFAHQVARYNQQPVSMRPTLNQLSCDAWTVWHYAGDFAIVSD